MIDFSALTGHEDALAPGSPAVALLRAEAEPFLAQIDGRERLRTEKVWPLRSGMWNALYRLEPSGVVAKLSSGRNDCEVFSLRLAGEQGIAVPRVLAEGTLTHPALPNASYFLMEYVPNAANPAELLLKTGTLTPGSLHQLATKIGTALATMHEKHFGYITRLGSRVATWGESLTDGFSPDWETIPPNVLFTGDLLRDFRETVTRTGFLTFTEGVFVHGDLNLNNTLVDADTHELRAIIDFAGYAGMPMFDLAYAAMPWENGFDYLHALVAAYRARSSRFDVALFYTSLLAVAYRHERFHTPAVHASLLRDVLPHLSV